MIYFSFCIKKMSEVNFNSKELNKILPSYLIDEIDNNQNHNYEKQINNLGKDNNEIIIIFYIILFFFYIVYI